MIIQYDIASGTFEEEIDSSAKQQPESTPPTQLDWQDCVGLQQIEVTTEHTAKSNELPVTLSTTHAQSFVENNSK